MMHAGDLQFIAQTSEFRRWLPRYYRKIHEAYRLLWSGANNSSGTEPLSTGPKQLTDVEAVTAHQNEISSAYITAE